MGTIEVDETVVESEVSVMMIKVKGAKVKITKLKPQSHLQRDHAHLEWV